MNGTKDIDINCLVVHAMCNRRRHELHSGTELHCVKTTLKISRNSHLLSMLKVNVHYEHHYNVLY